MVKASDAYTEMANTLQQAGIEDASFEVDALFSHVSGKHRLQTEFLTEEEYACLSRLTERRKTREPLQYIFGKWPFWDLELHVGPGVLIPRPETEEVCRVAATTLQKVASPRVLDLCSGSGALALGIQSLCPKAEIVAVELYEDAYFYLKKNIQLFSTSHEKAPLPMRADARCYHSQLDDECFDLIVANPPYVSEAEYTGLAPELFYEPKTALVAEDEGLYYYDLIAREYRRTLKQTGAMVFEIGARQSKMVTKQLQAHQYKNIRVDVDIYGCDRVVTAFFL